MNTSVQEHYGLQDLRPGINAALATAGLGDGVLVWAQLAPLDQFHVRGLAATQEMADALSLPSGAAVLDVGCGLGGPARYLAAEKGWRVTGIDLSEPFIDAARMLTERTRLTDHVTFLQGDALELPFPDAHFDAVWTQHTAMNIADRAKLYEGIHRVLKPGGVLAIYDVVEGNGDPLIYPVPWARTSDTSFLLTADAMRAALRTAGFTERQWEDKTDAARLWFATLRAAQNPSAPPALSLADVLGTDVRLMVGNFARNIEEGRARIVQAVLRRNV